MTAYYPPLSPFKTARRCACPRCGEGRLFRGLLTLAPACETCGLDFSALGAGDGPAVFVIFLVAPFVVGAALWFELRFEPPLWLHAVLWLPLTLGASLLTIRPLKAFLIAQAYRYKVGDDFG